MSWTPALRARSLARRNLEVDSSTNSTTPKAVGTSLALVQRCKDNAQRGDLRFTQFFKSFFWFYCIVHSTRSQDARGCPFGVLFRGPVAGMSSPASGTVTLCNVDRLREQTNILQAILGNEPVGITSVRMNSITVYTRRSRPDVSPGAAGDLPRPRY